MGQCLFTPNCSTETLRRTEVLERVRKERAKARRATNANPQACLSLTLLSDIPSLSLSLSDSLSHSLSLSYTLSSLSLSHSLSLSETLSSLSLSLYSLSLSFSFCALCSLLSAPLCLFSSLLFSSLSVSLSLSETLTSLSLSLSLRLSLLFLPLSLSMLYALLSAPLSSSLLASLLLSETVSRFSLPCCRSRAPFTVTGTVLQNAASQCAAASHQAQRHSLRHFLMMVANESSSCLETLLDDGLETLLDDGRNRLRTVLKRGL